MIHTTYINL